jgi:putative phosphoserine phosphatase / 1-acylglycerol-3-phosphate O-acyltransferase
VSISVGPAVKGLKSEDLDADTKKIMKSIVKQLPPEAREKRVPTDDELRRTYPHGYTGDPEAEEARRPGKD